MKKKCCHVRMLCPNKSCSKDNLDQVIDMQQYNPLIHQQLRESKIQAVIRICYHQRATRQIHRDVSSCRATQRETKWQAHGRRARKYGPATISDAQITVSEVLGWLLFNTAAFRGCWNGAPATGRHLHCFNCFLEITWFYIPLWFHYHVWICCNASPPCMINMKIFSHVWNLIKFKRQKYNWGSLACFIFV